jgi:hypothetical protein
VPASSPSRRVTPTGSGGGGGGGFRADVRTRSPRDATPRDPTRIRLQRQRAQRLRQLTNSIRACDDVRVSNR